MGYCVYMIGGVTRHMLPQIQIICSDYFFSLFFAPGGGEVLPYVGYIGMCRCEEYGFQAVYSRIGYKSERLGLE